jgi:hypothetical protein
MTRSRINADYELGIDRLSRSHLVAPYRQRADRRLTLAGHR